MHQLDLWVIYLLWSIINVWIVILNYSYMILAPAIMAAEKVAKNAAGKCLEAVGLDPDMYRIGHTKARTQKNVPFYIHLVYASECTHSNCMTSVSFNWIPTRWSSLYVPCTVPEINSSFSAVFRCISVLRLTVCITIFSEYGIKNELYILTGTRSWTPVALRTSIVPRKPPRFWLSPPSWTKTFTVWVTPRHEKDIYLTKLNLAQELQNFCKSRHLWVDGSIEFLCSQ